jgi:biotin carboxyl carrier protein
MKMAHPMTHCQSRNQSSKSKSATSCPAYYANRRRAFEVWPVTSQKSIRAQVGNLPGTPQPAAGRAAPAAPTAGAKSVLAPLPGVIVAISVKPGDAVEPGQELCIIEAMKMKNVIRASRAGTLEAVHVTLNQHVKHHDVLLEFTD